MATLRHTHDIVHTQARRDVVLLVMLVVGVVGGTSPLPFPLPANFTMGVCGGLDPAIVPGCAAPMELAHNIVVKCAMHMVASSNTNTNTNTNITHTHATPCSPACATSPLFQQVLARYAARLGGTGTVASVAQVKQSVSHVMQQDVHTHQDQEQVYWWRLNNINCNLHDMPSYNCANQTIDECKKTCANIPTCGGFLYYSATGNMALKNLTCWDDIAPLPPTDDGDDLFVMHNTPQPPPGPPKAPGLVTTVEVCVISSSEELSSRTDESYTLSVPNAPIATVTVNALTIFGAMHGLESLTQLTDVHIANKTIPSTPVVISDAPRFSFRGVMIDSARHFLPISHVKHVVDAASMAKLNVIHWHLVDSTSFPSCSSSFPTLCAKGGYPNVVSVPAGVPFVPGQAVYTTTELKDVVDYAKSRGVRIQPEWDVPGHGGWWMGMPELNASACADALDVTRPELYDFLSKFLGEMMTIFDDNYLFLGGDELDTSCYDNSPTIASWMKAHGLNASSTQQYFWQQMTSKVLPGLNRTISVWRADDPNRGAFSSNLPRGSVLNVYQSMQTAWSQTIPEGVPTVLSMAGQSWYLDHECGGYNQNAWTCIYSFNGPNGSWLVDPTWSEDQRKLMLGGETAMWGEGINEDNFDAFTWRGAVAASERLWTSEEDLGCPASACPGITPRKGRNYWMTGGNTRLADQLCRMSMSGIRTGPIYPGYCQSDKGTSLPGDTTERAPESEILTLRREISQLKEKLGVIV